MGSRSSPFLWLEFVTVFKWILAKNHNLTTLVEYMDDFFGVRASRQEAWEDMSIFLNLYTKLNVPIAQDKIQFAQGVFRFKKMVWCIRFTDKKRAKLIALVTEWQTKQFVTRKELQSMIGKFIHASIVYFGRGKFTRPLIHKLVVNRDSPRIRVASFPEIRLSLKWWELALQYRGERPVTEHLRSPNHQLWSDASSTKGLGAFYKTEWFCIAWNSWYPWYLKPDEASKMHINILELLAVVLSCVTWGERWNTSHVLIHCDNSSVCNVITAKRSKDEIMNHLLMLLHYVQIHYGFAITIHKR
jgi:hypothetical protein